MLAFASKSACLPQLAIDSFQVLAPLLSIHCASFLVVGADVPKRDETRWFFVHAIVNGYIALLALPAVRALLTDPGALYSSAETPLTSKIPICLALWLHVYHVVAYRMRFEDAWHHFVFVPTIGLPGYLYDWAAFGNLQLFFICGVPGMVIYAVLVLQRVGRVRFDEPLVSAAMNVCVRAPGILAANALLCHAVWNGAIHPPRIAWALQLALAPTNAIYYAHQSWSRFARRTKKIGRDV